LAPHFESLTHPFTVELSAANAATASASNDSTRQKKKSFLMVNRLL
jgi:hypothetical protein